MQFLVIINPNNGPGNGTVVDANFQTELRKLAGISNIRTVGYVPIRWTTRNMTTVLSDVSTYASWANFSDDYELDGIFFDETPNNYSANAVSYLNNIDDYVKGHSGFRGLNYVSQFAIESS